MRVRFHSAGGRYVTQSTKRRVPQYSTQRLGGRSTGHEADCVACGYPVTAMMGSVRSGDGVKHVMCPSLSERRRLRQMALENA
jgi:hypothetical protein